MQEPSQEVAMMAIVPPTSHYNHIFSFILQNNYNQIQKKMDF